MENKKEMRNWLDEMNLSHPFVIAGPCSAETEDQVMKIANQLKLKFKKSYLKVISNLIINSAVFDFI